MNFAKWKFKAQLLGTYIWVVYKLQKSGNQTFWVCAWDWYCFLGKFDRTEKVLVVSVSIYVCTYWVFPQDNRIREGLTPSFNVPGSEEKVSFIYKYILFLEKLF